MKKTIGILGGMGPEATAYFFELIIRKTKVEKDQDHIHVIIWSNPRIPARTDAILKQGPSPAPLLVEGVRRLRKAGADFVVMPCVTAHYYYDEVTAQENFPFLNILDEALQWTKKNLLHLKKAGIVSSTGTLESRLFHDAFRKGGIEVIGPEDEEQERVMDAIFGKKGIKAGYTEGEPKRIIVDTARMLIDRGAEAIIAGCTEVPLVLREGDIARPLIEPMSIMAEAAILKAGYELRSG
jgi:aspartate racemase